MLIWDAAVVIGALLRPAAKSVRENSGLAVLSVVLAFGLWIFVTDAENPEQTHRLDSDIPVRPVNVPRPRERYADGRKAYKASCSEDLKLFNHALY